MSNPTNNWAHQSSEYCKAVAPHATPLLQITSTIFKEISNTMDRLKAEQFVDRLLQKFPMNSSMDSI